MDLHGTPPGRVDDINAKMMAGPGLPAPMLYLHGNPGDPAADLLIMGALMTGLPAYAPHPITGALSADTPHRDGWEILLGALTLDVMCPNPDPEQPGQLPMQQGIRLTSAPPLWEEDLRRAGVAILIVGPPLPWAEGENVKPLMMLRGRHAAIGAVPVRLV